MKNILFLYFLVGLAFIPGLNGCGDARKGNNFDADVRVNGRNDSIRHFWEHFRKGTAFRINGKWMEAADEFEHALVLNPNHEDALFYLGNAFYETGSYAEAEKYWMKLAKLNPLSVKARYQLGNLYFSSERKDFYDLDKAEKEFLEAHRINRVITGPQMLLGQIMLIRGNYTQAGEYFKAVLGSDTRNMEATLLMGYVFWKMGDPGKAYKYYTAADSCAAEKKPVRGTLSEGDTKAGKVFFRPVEQSLFRNFLVDLGRMENTVTVEMMKNSYDQLDRFMDKLREYQ